MRDEIEKILSHYGVDVEGRRWLLRALHPAGETPCTGLPDMSTADVLRPDFRVQEVVHCMPGVPTYDAYIWSPPGDVNTVYWATAESPADFSAPVAPPTATYGTLMLQTSAWGTVTTNFAKANNVASLSCITNFPTAAPCGFRHFAKSITCHLVASAVSDQGQVYAAQYSTPPRNTGISFFRTNSPAVTADYCYSAGHTLALPTTETDLAATAPRYYTEAARGGVYLPLRLTGPAQPFASCPITSPFGTVLGNGNVANDGAELESAMLVSKIPRFGSLMGATITPTSRPSALQTSTPLNPASTPWVFNRQAYALSTTDPQMPEVRFDSGFDSVSTAVVIFRGLQGSGGGGFASSIQIKAIAGLEVVPSPSAMDRVFTAPPARYDPKAIEAYYSMVFQLNDAYPASYNSFGDILDKIASFAKKAWGFVKPIGRAIMPYVDPILAVSGNPEFIPAARAVGRIFGADGAGERRAPRARVEELDDDEPSTRAMVTYAVPERPRPGTLQVASHASQMAVRRDGPVRNKSRN